MGAAQFSVLLFLGISLRWATGFGFAADAGPFSFQRVGTSSLVTPRSSPFAAANATHTIIFGGVGGNAAAIQISNAFYSDSVAFVYGMNATPASIPVDRAATAVVHLDTDVGTFNDYVLTFGESFLPPLPHC